MGSGKVLIWPARWINTNSAPDRPFICSSTRAVSGKVRDSVNVRATAASCSVMRDSSRAAASDAAHPVAPASASNKASRGIKRR